MIQLQRLIKEFIELVQIDSESGNERVICDVLKRKFREVGCRVVEDHSAAVTGHGAGNIIATLEPNQLSTPPIYFTCHMDTVSPGLGVKPSIHNGYIVSDGTTILGSDDKAGIAALLEGIRYMQKYQIKHGLIQFVITVGEESGLVGARHIDKSLLHAEYGFALDSNGPVGEVVTSCIGQMKLLARIKGKAAHSGVHPEAGVSAIQIASRAIAKMRLGRIDPETTANIGHFHGGVAVNIVPESAEVSAEVRSCNMDKLHDQVDQMIQKFQEAARLYNGHVEVDQELLFGSYQFTQEDPVVQTAMEAVRNVGREPHLVSSGGGSDANIFNEHGIPTINLGIGYEDIHTTQERMPILELRKAAELVVELCKPDIARSEVAVVGEVANIETSGELASV